MLHPDDTAGFGAALHLSHGDSGRVRAAMSSLGGSFGRICGLLQEVIERSDEIAELARSVAPDEAA